MSDVDEFRTAYVDVDEWRDVPVRHRYVHVGSRSRDRFSIYLPPDEQYGGRFFQHVTPVPDSEHLAQSATVKRTRSGSRSPAGRTSWRATARASPACRGPRWTEDRGLSLPMPPRPALAVIAVAMYGEHRPYGYLYGGSGGGFRTIGAAENIRRLDGSCPTSSAQRWRSPTCSRSACTPNDCSATTSTGSSTPSSPAARRPVRGARRRRARRGRGHQDRSRPVVVRPPDHGMQLFRSVGAVVMADPSYFEAFWTEPATSATNGHPHCSVRLRHRCEVAATISRRRRSSWASTSEHSRVKPTVESIRRGEVPRASFVRPRGRTAHQRSRTGGAGGRADRQQRGSGRLKLARRRWR